MRDFRNCFLFLSFLIEIRIIYLGNLAVPVVQFVHGYLFSYAGSVLRKFAPMISISAFFSFSRRPVRARRNLPERVSDEIQELRILNPPLYKKSRNSVSSPKKMKNNTSYRAVCVCYVRSRSFLGGNT